MKAKLNPVNNRYTKLNNSLKALKAERNAKKAEIENKIAELRKEYTEYIKGDYKQKHEAIYAEFEAGERVVIRTKKADKKAKAVVEDKRVEAVESVVEENMNADGCFVAECLNEDED